jgi:hypothetical protein
VGLGLSAQRVDVSQSRKILAEILKGVPDDEQAKPAPDYDPGIAGGNTARVYNFDAARLPPLVKEPTSLLIDEVGLPAWSRAAARPR